MKRRGRATAWRLRWPPGAIVVTSAALALAACGTPLGAPPLIPHPARGSSTDAQTLPLARDPHGIQVVPSSTIEGRDGQSSGPARRLAGDPVGGEEGSVAGDRKGGNSRSAVDPFYRTPVPLSPAPPGSIIRSGVIDSAGQLPAGATATRVVYHSESITGADIAVSGVIVVPGGTPPAKGFPIVSWAHGTTGLSDLCAPSLSGVGAIPYLDSLLERRMIVVASDYQGLGAPGAPSYLVGQSEAQGVLDVARAARNLEGRAASNTVVVMGYSQGGQAALFAGQIAGSYAPELYVTGIGVVAPVTSLTELAPAAPTSRADGDSGFAVMALAAWSATYGDLSLDSVLAPAARRHLALVASACSGPVGAAYNGVPTDLLFKPGWSTNPTVQADDAANQPGRSPISAPVLVVQGTKDTLIPYTATTSLVSEVLCHDQHDTVRYVPIEGAGHDGALVDGEATILGWVSNRLAGSAAANTCAAGRTAR